jgi:competence protein ComEC
VAIAAVIVLGLRPETLVSPGFQMSFAATTALVAVFAAIRAFHARHEGWRLPKWVAPVAALVISSSVAGLATAPVAAAHFNRFADYGLIANLLSVPLMGLVVMPGAVIAAVLAPLGLHWLGLALMKPGIDWILWVADWVAGFEGAATPVLAPPPLVLPVLALGALWVILWQGRARWLGGAPMLAAFVAWGLAERPPLLVSESGALLGVLTPEGRALSKGRGDGFTAENWLENDGDLATQPEAHARLDAPGGDVSVMLGAYRVTKLRGRGMEARLDAACASSALVLANKPLTAPPSCPLFDPVRLRGTGTLAVWPGADGLRIVEANQVAGQRLWTPR